MERESHEYNFYSIQNLPENVQIQLAKFISQQKGQSFPAKMSALQIRIQNYIAKNSRDNELEFRKAVQTMNIKAVGKEIQAMLEIILEKIEKYIDRCMAERSLRSTYPMIQSQLIQKVYGKSYSINRDLYKNQPYCTPNETEKKQSDNIVQYSYDTFFQQLYELLFLLSTIFLAHYQLPATCDLSRFVIESFNDFANRNSESKIIMYDEKSLIKYDRTSYMEKIEDFFYGVFRKKNEEPTEEQQEKQKTNISSVDTVAEKQSEVVQNVDSVEWIKNNAKQQNVIRKSYQYIGAAYSYITQKYKKQQPQKQPQNVSLLAAALISETKSKIKIHVERFERKLVTEEQKQKIEQKFNKTSYYLCQQLEPKYRTILMQSCIEELDRLVSKYPQLKQQIVKQLMIVIDSLGNCTTEYKQSKKQKLTDDEFFFDQSASMITMLYKAVHSNYDPYRRRVIKQIIHNIENQTNSKINLISILRVLERLGINQDKQTDLCKSLREQKFKKEQFPLKFDEKNPKNLTQTAKQIQHQINRIYLMEFNKEYPIEKFMINRICQRKTKNKIVNICISGFLSEDTDKIKEWSKLISEMPQSEVYAINWASKSIEHMVEFAFKSVKDIIFADAGLGMFSKFGGPYIRAIAIAYQIYKKYNQNPFNPAFDCGRITGFYLAQLLISTFSHSFINLIGFSLGTEVIKATLQRLNERNKLHMINRIIMMGGAADMKQLQKIIENAKYPIDLVNCYSTNDAILKYMLRVCRPFNDPLGRNQISVPLNGKQHQKEIQLDHKIKNIDCTQFIDGHGDYRSKMHILGKIIDLQNE